MSINELTTVEPFSMDKSAAVEPVLIYEPPTVELLSMDKLTAVKPISIDESA